MMDKSSAEDVFVKRFMYQDVSSEKPSLFSCEIGTMLLLDGIATSSCIKGNPDDGAEKTEDQEIDKEDFGSMVGEFIHLELSFGIWMMIFSSEAHRRYPAHQKPTTTTSQKALLTANGFLTCGLEPRDFRSGG